MNLALGTLVRKMAVAALMGFGGVLLPAVLGFLDDVHNGTPASFSGAFWLSVVAGGASAALRGIFALSPINLMPSDKAHSLIKKV